VKVLVINCGSSSLKYQLFDVEGRTGIARGLVERIGEEGVGRHTYETDSRSFSFEADVPDHQVALEFMVGQITDAEHGAISDIAEVGAVGHRVVHGGEAFVEAAVIDERVIAAVEAQAPLAPLHNPPNLAGILAARRIFKDVPHVAVFDTAFHATMPRHAFMYAVPYELYDKYHVRRYGFHGTSHRFVARRAAEMLGKSLSDFDGITCHLGNGCSITAVRNGKSVDTSMGLTPLEGLMMGTRCGDIDPALHFFLTREAGMRFEDLDLLFNKKSGLLGVSGLSNDVRTLLKAADEGHRRARLALEMFAYRVRKYIGAYLAVLNGADAIVFTGGIGENAAPVRERICAGLDRLGVILAPDRNDSARATEAVISAEGSPVRVMVVPTNEELEIAIETDLVVRRGVQVT